MNIPGTIITIEESGSSAAVGIIQRHVSGMCNICGEHSTSNTLTVCRYWDCDDGWTIGKLCGSCARMCREPRPDDYAYASDGDAQFIWREGDDLDGTF